MSRHATFGTYLVVGGQISKKLLRATHNGAENIFYYCSIFKNLKTPIFCNSQATPRYT